MSKLLINNREWRHQEESLQTGDICQLEDEVPVNHSKRINKIESAGKKKITSAPYDVSNKKRNRSGKGSKSITLKELGIDLRDEEEEVEDDDEFDDDEVKSVQDDFEKGRVVYGKNKAVINLLNQVNVLDGNHGVISSNIMDEICISPKKLYDVNKNFTRVNLLGEGGVGKVHFVRDNVSKKEFVEKIIKKQRFARKEVEILLSLEHRNIAEFYGLIVNNEFLSVFMSYAGLSLEALVIKNQMTFSEDDIICLSIQAMSALAHMHQYGMVHMDIKPQNICIKSETRHLSLTDFGSSLTPQQPLDFVGVTPEYMSPELCQLYVNGDLELQNKQPLYQITTEDLNGKNDVYGFGCSILFIFLRMHAALMFLNNQINLQNFRINYLLKVAAYPQLMRHNIPNMIQEDLKGIVDQLLNGDVKQRLSAEEGKSKLKAIQQRRLCNDLTYQPSESRDDKHASIKLKLKQKIEGNMRTDNSKPPITKPPEIPQMVDKAKDESSKTSENQNIPNFDFLF